MPRQRSALRPRLECLEAREVPATFNVTTTLDVVAADGKRSLREAITAANTLPGADVIVLPAGVFKIAIPGASEDANATGDFDVTDSVTITGAGRGLTFIDAQQLDRVFQAAGSAPGSIKVVLDRMRIRNGKVDAPGGGVAVTNANLVVRDAAVSGNQATGTTGNGGGIFADSTTQIKLVRSTVADNTAGNFGGGMDASLATLLDSVVRRNNSATNAGGVGASTASLTNCTVSGNTAANNGGGVLAIGTATLTNCTVSDNTAVDGGGGGVDADTANLTNCAVSGNTAGNSTGDNGGGIRATTATLTKSTVSGNTAADLGGGIFGTTANLTNSIVSGNTAASFGGGIFAGTANLTNSTVSDNSAGLSGGGIRVFTANLTKSTVSGNTAIGGNGGGIFAFTTATLSGSTVRGNSADRNGGAINAVTASLTNTTVSGNSAGISGGGMYASTATLTRSTFSGNSTGSNGGGILADREATLTNCTVSGNSAGQSGGGLYTPEATLTNCTVAENLAIEGGGLDHDSLGPSITLRNTIVALNSALFGPDMSGVFTSLGHNLIGIGNASFTHGVNGDIVGTSVNPIDPKLGSLALNGGPTKTMALLAGSKAIDKGDNAALPATDQRGFPRKKDGNGDGVAVVDIGAFEV